MTNFVASNHGWHKEGDIIILAYLDVELTKDQVELLNPTPLDSQAWSKDRHSQACICSQGSRSNLRLPGANELLKLAVIPMPLVVVDTVEDESGGDSGAGDEFATIPLP